ncbi:uncharacterized protein LOC125230994 [Leguminivora glycinivorella]|uniref:uncharacterized protein LOC125230994 n=1 Tax=Leguminivora glycinivorella TaxID=1035111 RepID=UPI00200EC94A|nr:uncharacterized protein LOC125230994 [Leguminivora glycinivorella]
MEAATLKKKTTGLSKGKLKKTIKNVLCRPDSIHWPVVPEEDTINLRASLSNHKVEIPKFEKLKWAELKNIPKNERPKPPPIKKPEGLLFGLRECAEVIQNKDCSAVIVDSEVNPKSIVQPIIEACRTAEVPVICLKNLKELSLTNFGVKTACLGVKQGCLLEISKNIKELAKIHAPVQTKPIQNEEVTDRTETQDIKMTDINITDIENKLLKRTSKKSRVFVPPSDMDTETKDVKKKFIGQDFIEFSGKTNKENTNDLKNDKHAYKNMLLKRITNNPNRPHKGKKRKLKMPNNKRKKLYL